MIIISWDVGVIYLAYCILKLENDNIKILDWNRINLLQDQRIELTCCGKTSKNESCHNNALYYLKVLNEFDMLGFCKIHLSQSEQYWSKKQIEDLFQVVNDQQPCQYVKRNGDECGKKAKYYSQENNICYCSPHYQMKLKQKMKEYSPQLIKNTIVKKVPTAQIQLNLINTLDKLSIHFAKLGVEQVIIENQPSFKNPKMKSIANTLFDYFLIRGYIDKINQLDIKLVRNISPSNKLKVNEEGRLEIEKSKRKKCDECRVVNRNKYGSKKSNNSRKIKKCSKCTEKRKYKMTKELGIKYTKQLLQNDPDMLKYLEIFPKKDDICDSYLQGRYYLEFLYK